MVFPKRLDGGTFECHYIRTPLLYETIGFEVLVRILEKQVYRCMCPVGLVQNRNSFILQFYKYRYI